MKKAFRLVPGGDLTTPVEENDTTNDRNKVLFCEKDTSEKLRCPAEFADRFRGVSYATIAENLTSFNDLGYLPLNIKLKGSSADIVAEESKIPQKLQSEIQQK